MKKQVPYVFIGSSGEKLKHAEALQLALGNRKVLTKNWGQDGIFIYGNSNLESLYAMSQEIDFACFILDNDDVKVSRGKEYQVIRDNVLFEIGLCIGKLGRNKVFIIYDRENKPDMPSDLDGITMLNYEVHNDDLSASLNVTALTILTEIEKLKEDSSNVSSAIDISEGCGADYLIAAKNSKSSMLSKDIISVKCEDTSDLFFLFLNVSNCEGARTVINSVLAGEQDYYLEAVYDLLGTWDILIKFRTTRDADKLKDKILNKLIKATFMREADNKFSKFKLIDIRRQASTIPKLNNPSNDEKIYYTLLEDTDAYNNYRASRSFLYIEADGFFDDKGTRATFLANLDMNIKRDSRSPKVIESFCEGDDVIIIEVFSGCSQTSFINYLNKSVEQSLNALGLDKSDLRCYHYDETGLHNYLDSNKK